MSDATPAGAVSIAFQPDLTAVEAALAELRKGYEIPLRAKWIGPSGEPVPNASSVASTTPTTFASSRDKFIGPAGSGDLVGPSGLAFTAGQCFSIDPETPADRAARREIGPNAPKVESSGAVLNFASALSAAEQRALSMKEAAIGPTQGSDPYAHVRDAAKGMVNFGIHPGIADLISRQAAATFPSIKTSGELLEKMKGIQKGEIEPKPAIKIAPAISASAAEEPPSAKNAGVGVSLAGAIPPAFTAAADRMLHAAEQMVRAAAVQDRASQRFTSQREKFVGPGEDVASRRVAGEGGIVEGGGEDEGGGEAGGGGFVVGDGGGGRGRRDSRIFGLRGGGIYRYIGAAFLAREMVSVAQAKSQYDFDQQLSGGQPAAQLRNEQKYFQRVSSGFVGGILGQLVDPLGVEQNKIQLISDTAQSDEDFAIRRLRGQGVSMSARARADVSGLIGYRQQVEDAQQRRDELNRQLNELRASPEFQADVQRRVDIRKVAIDQNYDERKLRIQKELYQREFDRPGVQGRMFRQMTDAQRVERIRPALESGTADLESRRQTQFGQEDVDIRKKLEEPVQSQLDAADITLRNTENRLRYQERQERLNTQSDTNRFRYEMQYGGPTRARLREMQMERVNREAAHIEEGGLTPGAGEEFRQREIARLDFGDFQFTRRANDERLAIESETEHLDILSGHTRETQGQQRGTRRLLGEVQEITTGTERRRRRLIEEYGGTEAEQRGLLAANAREGRSQLTLLRNDLNESQRGEEINPFIRSTSGYGTLDLGAVQKRIAAAFKDVGNESKDLPGEKKNPADPLSGASSSANSPVAQSITQIQTNSTNGLQLLQQMYTILQQLNLQVA